MAKAEGLVGVELDLLEHRHQGTHPHLAQAPMNAVGSVILPLDVQQGQANVEVGVRIVARVHPADEGLAGVEIQLFHLVLLGFVHVDGVLVQEHRHGEAIHFADDPVLLRVGSIDDHEVFFCRSRTQADLAGGEILC